MAFSGLTHLDLAETAYHPHQTMGRNEVLCLLLALQTGAELIGVYTSEMSKTAWPWSVFLPLISLLSRFNLAFPPYPHPGMVRSAFDRVRLNEEFLHFTIAHVFPSLDSAVCCKVEHRFHIHSR